MQMLKEEAIDFFGIMYRGEHNIPGDVEPWGHGWAINHPSDVATYDSDFMTRLVFLAHDRCLRASVQVLKGKLKVAVHKRQAGDGGMAERHPTLADAMEEWRTKHPGSLPEKDRLWKLWDFLYQTKKRRSKKTAGPYSGT